MDRVQISLMKIFGIPTHAVVLLSPGQLPKTASGKIKRLACRQLVVSNDRQNIRALRTTLDWKTT